jgi:hypothetical protein
MPDTTLPVPDVPVADPLFNKAILLSLFPSILPVDAPASMTTVLTTLLNDLIDAANKAGEAGATPMLVLAPLKVMSMICYDAAKWVVEDYNQAIAAASAPTPAPAPPAADPTTPPPPAPEPAPVPAPTPPAPPAEGALPMLNGVSTVTLAPSDDVTLAVGAITTPDADTPVVLSIALDPSPDPFTGMPAYSLELRYTAHDGFTYTAGTLWPGITLYGKEGALLRLGIHADSFVTAYISQDAGETWKAFFTYPEPASVPLYAHVTQTFAVAAGNITAKLA